MMNRLVYGSLFVTSALSSLAFSAPFKIYKIKTLPASTQSVANDVAESRIVCGHSDNRFGETHAFVSVPWAGIFDVGVLPGGDFSSCNAVSNNGYAVGEANIAVSGNTELETRAFFWQQGQKIRELPALNGARDSVATDVNESGLVVGHSGGIAVIWDNTGVKSIGTLGGTQSFANAVNKQGWVTGTSSMPDGSWHAFVYKNGEMIDVGTLGGRESFGDDINDLGQVIGNSETRDGSIHAFVWVDGDVIDVDYGVGSSTGSAWSRMGLGAGGANFFGGPLHAALWEWDGTLKDLGALPGGELSYANAVNDDGMIVGYSFGEDNLQHAVYWVR